MYLSFMSSTLRAVFSGSSSSSQPRGLPVSTEQNRQARVHTAPINMMVAVPAFQHSPMFGHFASSHTVASRCSRTMFFTALNPAPAGSGARIQRGLPHARRRLFGGARLLTVLDGGEALGSHVLLAAAGRAGFRDDGNVLERRHDDLESRILLWRRRFGTLPVGRRPAEARNLPGPCR